MATRVGQAGNSGPGFLPFPSPPLLLSLLGLTLTPSSYPRDTTPYVSELPPTLYSCLGWFVPHHQEAPKNLFSDQAYPASQIEPPRREGLQALSKGRREGLLCRHGPLPELRGQRSGEPGLGNAGIFFPKTPTTPPHPKHQFKERS
jgi:hypothetical protein